MRFIEYHLRTAVGEDMINPANIGSRYDPWLGSGIDFFTATRYVQAFNVLERYAFTTDTLDGIEA